MNDLKFDGSNWNETGDLIQTVNIVTEDISNKFVTRKEGVLAVKQGKKSDCKGRDVE